MSGNSKPLAAGLGAFFAACYVILFFLVFIQHFFTLHVDKWLYWSLFGFILLLVLAPPVLQWATRWNGANSRCSFYILLGACFAAKLLWVLAFRTEPAADYLTFHTTAQMLADGWTIEFNYVALFPHIMGYSSFLSLFYMLFADGELVAPIVNVLLSTLSMALLYDLAHRLFNRKAAFLAAVLWIVYPSQTMYNALVLSEPLYTTIILAFWVVVVRTFDAVEHKKMGHIGFAAFGASLLLGAIQAVRPVAVILYIALMLWLLVSIDWKNKREVYYKAGFVIVVGLCLWGWEQANQAYNNARLGVEASTSPGYSIYVGFNEQSNGTWNKEDSARLFHYVDTHPDWTPHDVQRQMVKDAKERIWHGDIDFIGLLYNKLDLLWGDDAMAYRYSGIDAHQTSFIGASNAFYYFVMACSIVGLVIAWKRNRGTALLMLVLYVLGLTASHLLVEVAGRYHYSGTAVMVILAGIGLTAYRAPKLFSRDDSPAAG